MGHFLEKPPLLAHPLFRWQDVLWWKMIACYHDPGAGSGALDGWALCSAHALRAVRQFLWIEVGSVKVALSHPAWWSRTQAVGQQKERANMSKNDNIYNIVGTVACGMLVTFLATVVPYRMISSENHTMLPELEPVRFLGPFLILLGILGYLLCFANFILDAKGTPLPLGTQKHLIVKGLYQYVRNPMYISWFLILLGEAFFFRSLDILLYLLIWIVFFHFKVVFSEEPSLRNQFGASYQQYCKLVPRWIPRLKIASKGSK